jgi:HK97 family phage major capsid protein
MASKLGQRIDERAALKVEALGILDSDSPRTDAQASRLGEIETKVAALDADIALLAKLNEGDIASVAITTASVVEVGRDLAAEKPVTFGELLQAAAYNSPAIPAHRKATFLPNGVAHNVQVALQAAASGSSSGNAESGGLLVRNEIHAGLLARVAEEAKLAPRCMPLPIGEGNDGIEAPFIDETSRATGSRWGGVRVYRGAEADAMTASAPKLGKFELRLEEMFGLFYATDRVLRDATLLEALATKAFASEFAFKLDDEIVRGTGAGQCLGIVGNAPTVSVAKETNQVAATVVYENIINMHSRLLARCMPGAEWFVNQSVLPQLYKMYMAVGTGGVPVYLPANGVSAAPYGTLMGLPVNVIEQASALGTVGDIILCNLKNDYALISKPMTAASSIHVLFTTNQTAFRWVWPVIGKPVMASAVTPYKGSATYAPFVTLASRA